MTVDWLDPATPKALRLKLQEGDYHILHFVGHSGYVEDAEGADGGGVIYLEDEDHSQAPISDSQLVNLLGDQDSLRLVVLNSCEGARTSVRDPFAGIATSIVALGIPAVVAMQFEITDDAAIAFAEELYGSLIAREETIDVAVAEARKAVFTEVNETEWATPVLFLRNEDGRLFDFVPITPVVKPDPRRGWRARWAELQRQVRPGLAGGGGHPAGDHRAVARRELTGLVRRCDREPWPEPGRFRHHRRGEPERTSRVRGTIERTVGRAVGRAVDCAHAGTVPDRTGDQDRRMGRTSPEIEPPRRRGGAVDHHQPSGHGRARRGRRWAAGRDGDGQGRRRLRH